MTVETIPPMPSEATSQSVPSVNPAGDHYEPKGRFTAERVGYGVGASAGCCSVGADEDERHNARISFINTQNAYSESVSPIGS